MLINTDEIKKRIELGYIRSQSHDTAPLFIFNYTEKCQFERAWDEHTMMCRGLITDIDGRVVARPFTKFFNLEEHTGEDSKLPPIPLEDFEVTEKLDGSLGILYWIGNKPLIATRGSFNSDQAIKATNIFQTKYAELNFDKNKTYLFEIIYPENRIVVDYGGVEDLFLLSVIDIESGKDLPLPNIGVPLVKRFDGITDLKELTDKQEENKEGFVIRFSSGMRVKIKFEEYKRLHRLITGVNARSIWDLLRNNQPFDELLEKVPDEFYKWVEQTRDNLVTKYNKIENQAKSDFKDLGYRKENALYYQTCKYPSILFSMLDSKPYSEIIWKMLKPKFEVPFKTDEL